MIRFRAKSVLQGTAILLLLALSGAFFHHAYGAFYRSAYPIPYREVVGEASRNNDLPPALVYAVIRTESGFNPQAQSSVEARGLMQITKATFEWAQYRLGNTDTHYFDQLFTSDLNIYYGTAILRLLLDEFGTEENALCAYHAGWGSVKSWLENPDYSRNGRDITHIPFGDTQRYVAKVLETKRVYQTLYTEDELKG